MQNRRLIVIGIILAVVLGLLISNYVGLFGEDYGTGLNINTETRKFEHHANYNEGAQKGGKFLYTADGEQLNNKVYISSWQPQGKSTTIVTTAKFYFRTYYENPPYGTIPWIYLGQYYWKILYEDPQKQWHTLIDGEHNYINREYVVDVYGKISGNLPNANYEPVHKAPNIFGDNTWTDLDCPPSGTASHWSKWVYAETSSLSFKIKGTHIGAIRAYCVIEYMEMDWVNYWIPWDDTWRAGTLLASEDWAYLAPGIGKVDVLGVNSIRQNGTTYTEGTNREVPLYVFEEGSTVHLSVDTGYAGAVTGQKGWRLAIYKPTQAQPLAVWWLDDDLRGYEITWTIPKGTWTPGGLEANRLEVHLTNTIIDQSEVTFMVVDNISKIPEKPTIETDKPKYLEGETVTLTLTAKSNSITKAPIKTFYVEIRYNNPYSADFDKFYVPAHHVSGLTYRGTTKFEAVESGKLIIYAWAWDEEGRYSDRTDKYIDVEEGYGNYKITIFVNETDGTPISGAKIILSGQIKYTSSDGKAVYWLPWGTYPITVEKAGYNTYRGQVIVNADKTIVVTLTPLISPPEGWATYLVIAIVLTILILIGVVIYKKYKRR